MPVFSLGTMGSFAMTTTTDQTITGSKTFLAGSATAVPVTIRGASGQTANLLEVRNVANTATTAFIRSDGLIGSTFGMYAKSGTPGVYSLMVQGSAGQTANVFETQRSDNSIGVYVGPNHDFFSTTSAMFTPFNSSAVPLNVKGAAGQAANLQNWTNSAGSVVSLIGADGGFRSGSENTHTFGTFTAAAATRVTIDTTNPAAKGLVVRGVVGQTNVLMSAQNSAGNDVWNVNADAAMGLTRTSVVPATNGGYGYLYVDAGGNLLYKSSAGNIRTVATA